MVFLSIILCVLNIQAQSHFKLYKSEGHFYLNGEMNEIHVDSILLEAECRRDLAGGERQRNPRIQRLPRNSVRIGRELHPPDAQPHRTMVSGVFDATRRTTAERLQPQ